MKSLISIFSVFSSVLLCSACGSTGPKHEEPNAALLENRARAIHRRVITLDTHDDFRLGNFTEERNYSSLQDSQVDLVKMRAGGLDVAWLVVFTGQADLDPAGYKEAHQQALAKFTAIHRLVEEFAPEQAELALTSADVRRIHEAGKSVIMIAVENAYPLGLDLSRIEDFHQRGARYMSLAHNGHNQFSDSHTGEAKGQWLHAGLSELGRAALKEMNRLGIMVDISHPSKAAMLEMIELSRAPLVASHSAARALCDSSRNLDDEQLLLLKENGGVVQVVAFRSYVNADKDIRHAQGLAALQRELGQEFSFQKLGAPAVADLDSESRQAYDTSLASFRSALKARTPARERRLPPVDVADFVDHIDYIVELIGIDHVGISSDFDGGGGVRGWNDASETFNVTLELVQRGYSEAQIAQLWSGNLLRVLDQVQRIALLIQAQS